MEINEQFLQILEGKGLIRIGEISDLSGRIAIDAEWWLASILPEDLKSSMMGSISMSLRPSIQSELSRLQTKNLIFIFPGLPLFEKSSTPRQNLWSASSPPASLPSTSLEFSYIFSELLHTLGCETFRSPYLSSSQMSYFFSSHLVSHMAGRCDLLFYSVPRIIVQIMQTRYKYIKTEEVYETLKITPLELKQVFVLSGYLAGLKIDWPLTSLIETIKYVNIDTLTKDVMLVDEVINVLNAAVAFAPGQTGLVYQATSRFYGCRLTRDLYFALCNLQVSTLNFVVLAFAKFFEKRPVADSNNYRRMVRNMKVVKAAVLKVLFSVVPREYARAPVKIQYWYSEIEDEVAQREDDMINWNLNSDNIKIALAMQKKYHPDLQFCLKWNMFDYRDRKLLISSTPVPLSADPIVLHTKVLFTFLESIGYIYPNGVPTVFGNSFLKVDPEWQKSAIYLQELLKYGMLNGRTLNQSQCMQLTEEEFQKNCVIQTDDKSRHAILLISRVFSLVEPTLNEENWTGEVDYDLAQFHSLVHAIFKNYQQLYEAIVIKEFIDCRDIGKNISDLCKWSPLLPLPNPALGIAVKRLMVLDDVDGVVKEMPHMADIFMDLQRGWMFWKNFVKIMGVFKGANAVPDNNFINEITDASKKLKEVLMRARIKISN